MKVEKIIENKIIYTTIGNEKPKGICGSGIVDLISELFLNNWIDFSVKTNFRKSTL